MLRRVPPDEIRIGMFVHAIEGSWLQHPFWRTRFVLESDHDLQRPLDSGIPGIIVDDERGAAPGPRPDPARVPIAPPPARKPRPAGKPRRRRGFAKPRAATDLLSTIPRMGSVALIPEAGL